MLPRRIPNFRPRQSWATPAPPREGDELVTSTDLQRGFGEVLWRVATGDHVMIVTNQGRLVAAFISVRELERLRRIEEQHNRRCEMPTETMRKTIDPAEARALIAADPGERAVRQERVAELAAQMAAGTYVDAGPIVLEREGELIHIRQGLHRLHAIVASGATLTFTVVDLGQRRLGEAPHA